MKSGFGQRLRAAARAIWQAGVAAVDSERLVAAVVRRTDEALFVCGHEFPLSSLGRIAVVGAGKAGAGMAAACQRAIGEDLASRLVGWVNVPSDCVRPLERIHLHAARPAGVNEPTAEGVAGTRRILEIVSELEPHDLCVVLLSGGGSALLPAPVPEITLEDKQRVTRLLMHAGAAIDELNCVRRQLSQVKGGELARAIRAGTTVTLIISDVIGDPLETIASGPTVPATTTSADALAVLEKYADRGEVPAAVLRYLERRADDERPAESEGMFSRDRKGVREAGGRKQEAGPFSRDRQGARDAAPVSSTVHNHVIGNNATALAAAAGKARELGYAVHSLGSDNAGEARRVGVELAEMCLSIRDRGRPAAPPACVLSGGEPVVHLVPTDRSRRGGRNQEVAVAALRRLWDEGLERIVLLSGGTDGEDGPTDATGGIADADVLGQAREQHLDPAEFLAINDTYPFLERTGGLLVTGPTHTNVMDLRVALVGDAHCE